MNITGIRREKLVEALPEPIASILGEASEVLGYAVTPQRVTYQSKLRTVLAKLEIEPLNEADVVRYQAETVVELLLDSKHLDSLIQGSPDYRFFSYWTSVELTKYHDPIPEFVLAKAIQIKKEFPEAEFFIQSLEGDPDPFLLVKDGYNDHAYIEVWAEPKFEGRLRD